MPAVPTDRLDTPTIGAWRRAHAVNSWSDDARHLYAVTIATEAQRRLLLERLDSITHFLHVGATPDQAIARLADLVATWHKAAT